MKYIIYMDVFFMVNLIMDTIVLKLAAFFINPHTTFIKCVAGGTVGSILSCLCLLLPYENMVTHMLIFYIFIAIAMVLVSFGKGNVGQVIKRTGMLYFVTIFMGGALNFVYDYTYLGYGIRRIIAMYEKTGNISKTILYTSVAYATMRILIYFAGKSKKVSELVNVKITVKGKSTQIKGLVDSGNSLNDPYFGKPVHVVQYDAVQMILKGVDIHKEKYRLVPFHSLGKKNGMIEVIEIDEIAVFGGDGENNACSDCMYKEDKPAIGLYYSPLSGRNEFCMLLHKNVLNNWR